jgi:hypothetical protein
MLEPELAVAAVVLNIITLLVVIYQTSLTRNSLKIANQAIEIGKEIRQLEMLPRADFVIRVRHDLEAWNEHLSKAAKLLEINIKEKNEQLYKEISQIAPNSPSGLIDRYMFENAPNWLSEIWITGARYYYSSTVNLYGLWDYELDKPNRRDYQAIIERCQESSFYIQRLLAYVDEIVPDVYLNCPASLSDEKFLTKD